LLLKKTRNAPSTKKVETCFHLRRVFSDRGGWKTLLRKIDEQKRALD